MTKKDLKRYSTIQDCIDGIYTVPQAAKILGLSDRQVQRIKKEVLENGPKGVIHKGRGKISNKAIHPKTIDKIVELKKEYIYMAKGEKNGVFGKFFMVYFRRFCQRAQLVSGRCDLVHYHHRNSCGHTML